MDADLGKFLNGVNILNRATARKGWDYIDYLVSHTTDYEASHTDAPIDEALSNNSQPCYDVRKWESTGGLPRVSSD